MSWKKIIPGQVKANTWTLLAIGVVVAFALTGQWWKVCGAVLVAVGVYFGEQTAHLMQENHADMDISGIERQQRRYPRSFQNLGRIVFGIGIWLLVR